MSPEPALRVMNSTDVADVAAKIATEQPIRSAAASRNILVVGVVILVVLAGIAALYVGKEIVLPLAFAIIFKLLLQPILDFLCNRFRLPNIAGAILLIIGLFATIGFIVFVASGPAAGWAKKIPDVVPTVKEKLVVLRTPIDFLQKTFTEIEDVSSPRSEDRGVTPVAVKSPSPLANKFALGALATTTQFLTTMIILFFLLAAGDRLLRGLIEVLPSFSDKKQTVDIANQIQRQIGGYLFTITVMNSLVGIVTGLAMWSLGLGDPVLWGAIAFVLNFVPVLGPLAGIALFFIAGIVSLDWPWHAAMPALVYLLIHIIEGEIVTPMLLAKRFTLNPVIVIVSIFFWHALWGVPGAFLAVPLLAMFKIICDRVQPLNSVGHIIGS